MIHVLARFHLQQEKIETAIEIAGKLIKLTRQEEGCRQYTLIQSTEQAEVLVILEEWETQSALEDHSQSEHFRRFVPQLAELCTSPPIVETFRHLQ